jgi:hypothetical protein
MENANNSKKWLCGFLGLALATLGHSSLSAGPLLQVPTKEDSGWVSLIPGGKLESLYVYENGWVDIKAQKKFRWADSICKASGSYAILATVKEYSTYRMRVDYRFDSTAKSMSSANAGMLVGISTGDARTIKTDTRPRSIEVNLQRNNGYIGSLWASRTYGPYMTSTVVPGTDKYLGRDQGGMDTTFDVTSDSNRVLRSSVYPSDRPVGEWNHLEAQVYGDSGLFFLNGVLRTSSWNWVEKKGSVTSGGVGLMTEGYDVSYSKWEIMELDPATLEPLHARKGCQDKSSTNYDPRAVIASPDSCYSAVSVRPSSTNASAFKASARGKAFTADGRAVNGQIHFGRFFPLSPM